MTDTHTNAQAGFATLVLSLVTNAAVFLGDMADPATGQPGTPDTEAASHIIDLLAMLQEKTRGNLTADEEHLLDQVLFDLRMRFVAVKDQKGHAVQPEQDDQKRIIIP